MIEITVHPKVAIELKKAFPKPAKSASRALEKYVSTLEEMLFKALQIGQTPMEMKLDLFSISLHSLANKGGQIGKGKKRVHAWLRENGLALVESIELGSNHSGMVSKVKLTELVTLSLPQEIQPDNTIIIDDVAIANELLADTDDENADLINIIYPDFEDCLANQTLDKVFDVLDIDVKSLENYMQWLRNGFTKISKKKRNHYLFQAHIILSVAKDKGGKYYQRKKLSDFGRTYYSGTSVQNVNKELRRAMLGNCWEYDIRSSVTAWKMGYAQTFIESTHPHSKVTCEFPFTLSYLANKASFMKNVQDFVYDISSELTDDLQMRTLKQAFTALSFGARKTVKGWMDSNGSWTNPALVDIIQVKDERERFLVETNVCGFIAEQNKLDKFLFDTFKQERPDLLKLAYLQTQGGNPSKAKAIAFMYQHEETTVMDIVRRAIIEHGKTVLANIHDAIIVKQKLSADLKNEIELRMQEQTQNPYWRLGVKVLKRYETDNIEAKLEEAKHKKKMQELEADAVGYKSPFTS